MESKLFDLGLIKNREKYVQDLQSLTDDNNISNTDIDDFINDNLQKNYYDENGKGCNENEAVYFSFHTPFKTPKNEDIYGTFYRVTKEKGWMGVLWQTKSTFKNYVIKNCIQKIGLNAKECWDEISNIAKEEISIYNIGKYVQLPMNISYYGTNSQTKATFPTSKDKAKLAIFETDIKKDSESICGWFTKEKGKVKKGYVGITWGTRREFRNSIEKLNQARIGKIYFKGTSEMNKFLDDLASKVIPEPWEYIDNNNPNIHNPILKSYIEYELDRLFYEAEELKLENKIIYNQSKDMICFNTNLLNKYGRDLFICGSINADGIDGKDIIIAPSDKELLKKKFASQKPEPPQFFQDINEIIFYRDWIINDDMEKYDHIIEDRIDRFPKMYQGMDKAALGTTLQNSISFAQRIAQRNYKFIVPMYYPTRHRIQLLMPIYLGCSYSSRPDFALVLTPEKEKKMYSLETILGLQEVYQDARLIAKPEESWLTQSILQKNEK